VLIAEVIDTRLTISSIFGLLITSYSLNIVSNSKYKVYINGYSIVIVELLHLS